MAWNYEEYLQRLIEKSQRDVSLTDFKIEVATEQSFAKIKTYSSDTIYVVIKYLSSNLTLNAITQPVQVLILTEQNSLQSAQIIFNNLAENNNFATVISGTTYIKQSYTKPVVLSNFNEVGFGYRSVMYMSVNLYIMENVVDVSFGSQRNAFQVLMYSNTASQIMEVVSPLTFSVAYSMSPNTQPIPPGKIATSVKSVSTFAISLSVPLVSTYNFIKEVNKIMNGSNTGNEDFIFSFQIGDVSFNGLKMKLTSCQLITSPDQVPSLNLGFML